MQLSIFQVWPKNDRSVIPCFWAKPAERPRHACQLQRSEEGPLETLFAAAQEAIVTLRRHAEVQSDYLKIADRITTMSY
jgi:hypothetical protein